ncbi:MAG: phytanoyl-CoA dioxygenase family protein [Betaproteobacteria bacterium]
MDTQLRQQWQEDGAVLLKDCLNAEMLAECRAVFDWIVENPGPSASGMFSGEQRSHVDNSNPLAKDRLDALVAKLPFGKIFSELWGSENVWYFAEEVFLKSGGKSARTSFHQDTSYLPWAGSHFGNAWISFERVPKQNSIEIVRGTHRGIYYDGPTFRDPDDPTAPLHGENAVPFRPRLPDVDAELAQDPKAYEILSWDVDPGDVVLLHPHSLHGGAHVDAAFPDRHTLVLRFFGDNATYYPLPQNSAGGFPPEGVLFVDEMKKLREGEPFRSPVFQQVA